MSRTQDHHVISLHVGAIHAQSDGGFCRSIKWIDRHGEESEITLFAEAGPECLRLHTDAEARLDAYTQQAKKGYVGHDEDPDASGKEIIREDSPEHEEWLASMKGRSCLPETAGTVDLQAEAEPDNAADALRPKPAMRSWNPADYTG